MEIYRLKIQDDTYDINEFVPFAIALLDLIYDGDIGMAKADLQATALKPELSTVERLYDRFDIISSKQVYSPIEIEEFKAFLEETGLSFSSFKNGTFSGFQDKIMTAADKQDYESAQGFLDLLLESNMEKSMIAELKGTLYIEAGEIDEGIKWLDDAIEVDPTLVSAYSTLGQAYYNRGEFEKSAFYWEQEIVLAPSHLVTYFMLADAYYNAGKMQKAIEVLDNLLKSDTDNILAKYQLMEFCRDTDNEKRAMELENEILESVPVYPSDIEVWAKIQFKYSNYAIVKEKVEELLAKSSEYNHLKLLLIVPDIKLGDNESAKELLKEFKDNEAWYFYGKKELFNEFLSEEERKACGIL